MARVLEVAFLYSPAKSLRSDHASLMECVYYSLSRNETFKPDVICIQDGT